ncbi:MAG TPA: hypothetical protein VGO52_26345 [Hyphomonadaceae bacterium]|jgi:hypothetical protein|nr:hypothetical protein [Hyphomonadaceae bacterium]
MNLHGDASNRFTMKTRQKIEILELRQHLTYEGLLEGVPTRERNQRQIDGLVASLSEQVSPHWTPPPVFLVPPFETPISMPDGKPYPFETPARLPSVTCIARLQSYTTRDPDMDYSNLTVIWFQEAFALPIAEDISTQLQQLDWTRLATDYEF